MADDKKADKKAKSKGVVTNYNKMPVTKRGYYYDYNEVSQAEKGFADAFTELEGFNTKLKDELKKEKTVKLSIQDNETIKEGLMAKASFLNDMAQAKIEYSNYRKAGGKLSTMEGFLEVVADLVTDGYKILSGSDVAEAEAGNMRRFS